MTPHTVDLVKSAAERLAHEEFERAERRRQDLAQQRSALNSPDVRIRTWERLHQLRLLRGQTHPILDLIAIRTRLTLAEVREEQRTRALLWPRRGRAAGISCGTIAPPLVYCERRSRQFNSCASS